MSLAFLSSGSEILAIDFNLPGSVSFSLVNVYFVNGMTPLGSLDAAFAACKNSRSDLCWDFQFATFGLGLSYWHLLWSLGEVGEQPHFYLLKQWKRYLPARPS